MCLVKFRQVRLFLQLLPAAGIKVNLKIYFLFPTARWIFGTMKTMRFGTMFDQGEILLIPVRTPFLMLFLWRYTAAAISFLTISLIISPGVLCAAF